MLRAFPYFGYNHGKWLASNPQMSQSYTIQTRACRRVIFSRECTFQKQSENARLGARMDIQHIQTAKQKKALPEIWQGKIILNYCNKVLIYPKRPTARRRNA
jgi:hypothetical protein